MTYAYDASLISRIQPRIKQWEATTGRRIAPTVLDSLIKEQMEAEVGKAQQSRALDLQEQQFQNQKEQQDKASKAATVKGAFDMATTAGMLGLTYKSVTKPSAMSELIAYQKGLAGGAGKTLEIPSTGAFSAPTAEAAGYTLKAPIGAQTALAGGAPAVGAQTVPAVASTGISAPEMAAVTGQGAWVEPAAATSGMGVASALGVAGAAVGLGSLYQQLTGAERHPISEFYHGTANLGKNVIRGVENVGKEVSSFVDKVFGW